VDGSLALRLDELDRAEAAFALVLGSAPSARERAAALTGLGHVAQRRGAVSEAVSLFEDAIAACAGDDPEPELAEGLGRAYASLGELASAIAVLRAALRRAREQGDTTLEVRFACLLGYALTDNGDFAEAERVIGEALETGRHLSDPYTRARLLWSRSRLLGEQGRGDLAARHALEALSILKLTEDAYAIGRAHQLLAGIYVSTERIDEAAELLREARPLIEANATPVEVAHFEIDEARVLARLGERERAASLAMSATGKLRGAMPMVAGDAYLLLGEIYEELGDVERAREVYELAVELLAEQPPSRYLVEANTRLATLLERLERPDLALEALKRALGVQSRVGRPLS
jgi:tetratricopeptide (TPR) repeat protein